VRKDYRFLCLDHTDKVPTISFLFVDQVGSTAQLQALGDEKAAPVRRSLFDIFQSALTAHGGTEVDNTGDGIMATFTSAVDAVECAAAIQRGVRRHNRNRPPAESLEVRAGIHTGEPVTDEAGRNFGLAVVVAARLCAAADGGQVLVSDLVRALCTSRDNLAFSPVGSLALKGVGQPVPAHAVLLEVGDQSGSLALPDAVVAPAHLSFVGRATERAAIESAWDAAQNGALRLVLVSGEPGVGKTRLVAEAALTAHAQGAIVLFGRCDDELGFPYQPFVEALRHVVRHTPASQLTARLGRYAGELARLLPELPNRSDLPTPVVSDPETERYRLFDAVTNWLVALAGEAPVLFVIDDLHWASKPTLMLFRHVVRSFELSHVCVLATYRQDEVARGHPLLELLADLRRETGVYRMTLQGLSERDVVTLLGNTGHHDVGAQDRDLAKIIHAETDGNAFFVAEVLRNLVESGEMLRHDDGWTFDRPMGELSIPESVRE
jgi:class 3 adenylate cyclase